MPELPEVEVLVRHLRPLVMGRVIRAVRAFRKRVIAPTPLKEFGSRLVGAKILGLERRGKYLLFQLRLRKQSDPVRLLGHLGMTGRMYLARKNSQLPKHAAVVLDLGREQFVYEDTRYFGRLTLETSAADALGPEPLRRDFAFRDFAAALSRSRQAIKVKLLDQSLVAGIGNIYASEALFWAGISPRMPACRLSRAQVRRLQTAIRKILREAIELGSTIPLSLEGRGKSRLFYFGQTPGTPDFYGQRLRVYDREGEPCLRCQTPIRRMVQAARSTFFCPACQTRN